MTEDELPVTPSQGRYLCGVLYQTLGSSGPVGTGDLARRLSVSRASVTETIEAFDERGLLAYEPYQGVELTTRGEAIARRLFWRQCAIRRFFEETIGMPLETDRAYRIGFSLSTATIRAISEYVDQPCEASCEATSQDECDLAVPTRSPQA